MDYAGLMDDIRTLKWRWMAVAILLELAVYVCQAWRWNILLSPVERLPLWPTVKAIYIGVFASGVLPLRTGEIIRCYLLAFWNELPVSLAFTSGAIERVIDGLWLVAAFGFTAGLLELPRYMIDGVEVMAAVLALLSMVFIYVLFRKQHAHTLLARVSWGSKFAHVLDEIHRLGDWRTLGRGDGRQRALSDSADRHGLGFDSGLRSRRHDVVGGGRAGYFARRDADPQCAGQCRLVPSFSSCSP